MTKKGIASSMGALALLVARAASAQPQYTPQADTPQWLKDSRYSDGIGVRAGDFEFHPGIAGEVGYDSNWFQRSSQQGVDNGPPAAPVIPAVEFRVTPSLYMSLAGASSQESSSVATSPAVAFRAGITATYRAFLGTTSDASQSQNDIAGQANVGGSADARLDILPGRTVGGAIFANYARVILPNEANANPNISFNQDNIGAGAELAIQPGSGTLDWHFGYRFATTLFEETEGQPFANFTNEAYTRGRWRFRPKTALLYDATLDFFTYSNATQAEEQGLVSSTPARARIGMTGLVTDRLSVLAMIGYGASFLDNKIPEVQQFDSVIGSAELKWFLTASPGFARASDLGLALSAISVGFTRDFQNSYLGNFLILDRGYVKFDYLFAGRVAVQVQGGVEGQQYPTLWWLSGSPVTAQPRYLQSGSGAINNGPFSDVRADATLFAQYNFTQIFGLNATFRYTQVFSNVKVQDFNPGPGAPVPTTGQQVGFYGMDYQRFEAYLGLRLYL
ncbi:MAG TPA: outer membrane beta-barrel protein [Polyangiaceae bacterium]|nr:outer membrane beta-barrel protein [Polyangiaceae bacterium]